MIHKYIESDGGMFFNCSTPLYTIWTSFLPKAINLPLIINENVFYMILKMFCVTKKFVTIILQNTNQYIHYYIKPYIFITIRLLV